MLLADNLGRARALACWRGRPRHRERSPRSILARAPKCAREGACAPQSWIVIPSEVENVATGGLATVTGRPTAERTGSERIKSPLRNKGNSTGSFDFA